MSIGAIKAIVSKSVFNNGAISRYVINDINNVFGWKIIWVNGFIVIIEKIKKSIQGINDIKNFANDNIYNFGEKMEKAIKEATLGTNAGDMKFTEKDDPAELIQKYKVCIHQYTGVKSLDNYY